MNEVAGPGAGVGKAGVGTWRGVGFGGTGGGVGFTGVGVGLGAGGGVGGPTTPAVDPLIGTRPVVEPFSAQPEAFREYAPHLPSLSGISVQREQQESGSKAPGYHLMVGEAIAKPGTVLQLPAVSLAPRRADTLVIASRRETARGNMLIYIAVSRNDSDLMQ